MANLIGEGDGRHPPATADDRPQAPLRTGWTTGTCAAAAAAAAYQALLTGAFPDPVTVTLPRGGSVTLPLHLCRLEPAAATASVIKDAGDDPDVTHGAEVVVTVAAAAAGHGITFHGGAGVGIVTLPGLPVAVGEPAINPGPRQMIGNALTTIATRAGTTADVQVTIAIPGGAELAERTLNGRLGIRGGLSILGTTGVVKPFSCAAWIHSLHRGVDVARASRLQHLAATTGSVSEAAVQRLYGLPDAALIDMGDFAGGLLKYLRTHPVPRLTLAGGFAKLAKLAQGQLYLHSAKSRVDLPALIHLLSSLPGGSEAAEAAAGAETAAQVLAAGDAHRVPLADAIAGEARAVAAGMLTPGTALDVLVFDRSGRLIGRAG
ncbi:Cobalt-precorrin-5B C(1)-methyltransferase [uncultured Defluviicoccus sp.]|uniref:Cobalt-precorrin-5B C(1)-methyltransferase n=1 Tax=metagenome TaxID=256318 RepID=A0A380TAF3_9ZZZZ|nr:Cobalt-precorrin-5B C(1)-methyltransferase [uncultured Defluviicoccus sp.]